MDYRTHQRRLLPGAGQDVRAVVRAACGWSTSCTRCSPTRTPTTATRRELETLAAGVKAIATWHATRDDPELPRGLRRRGLPARQPLRGAEGRHRRVHDLRGRQHDPAAARGQEPADRLQGRVRRARPARDGAVRGRAGARRARRAHAAAQARRRRRPARPRHPARPVPLAPRAPARGRGAAAQARHRRRPRPVLGADRLPGPRGRDRALVGRPRRARVVPGGPGASTSSAACTRCTRSRPSAATTRSTGGSRPRARRRSSRPSTSCAPSCARTRGRWSTRSACRRPCSATRAWSRSRCPREDAAAARRARAADARHARGRCSPRAATRT